METMGKAVVKNAGERKTSLIEKAARKLDEGGGLGVGNGRRRAAERAGKAPAPVVKEPVRTSRRVVVDFEKMRRAGIVTHQDERTRIAEEFRLIKRPLLLKAFRRGHDAVKNGHLIMVTSANPGEGKTFTALSLAMSIASEPDLTVLLVDANIADPTIPAMMGIECDKGLVDLLETDDLDVADVMLRTDLDNLSIIPAGRSHSLATELLASDRMTRFISDVTRRYPDRVIIMDAPSVLASSQTGVLALHAGQIVFVVEAEHTSQEDVRNALHMIEVCKHVGLILNKTRSRQVSEKLGTYSGSER